MRSFKIVACVIITAVCLLSAGYGSEAVRAADRTQEEAELDRKLYAKAAALIDMDSGRVLYEKNGEEILPMASTTKIMTCILALESSGQDESVEVSAYAAGQPKVRLGMKAGQTYRMEDLLLSLMLESHNDSAAAIAEHIGGRLLEEELPAPAKRTKEESRRAVGAFCRAMTEKAKEIGCNNTCFLTPNGLDASLESGKEKQIHGTTAEDLAHIMRYCLTLSDKKEEFLRITRTPSAVFSDLSQDGGSHSCSNHNAFLGMMEGALSGKTGFTGKAGYCYVGALERDGERLALALLACGWPNHKTWKWADCRQLFSYGLDTYAYREFSPETVLSDIEVTDGAAAGGNPYERVTISVNKEKQVLPIKMLVKEGEEVTARLDMVEKIKAPVRRGDRVGTITYCLKTKEGEEPIAQEVLTAGADVEKKDYRYVLCFIVSSFFLKIC